MIWKLIAITTILFLGFAAFELNYRNDSDKVEEYSLLIFGITTIAIIAVTI